MDGSNVIPQKTCPSCGTLIDEDSVFCSKCGYRFDNAAMSVSQQQAMRIPQGAGAAVTYVNVIHQQPVEPVEQRLSGIGIAGFICAVVGLFIFPWILSILGLIFGSIGWYHCKTEPEKYRGLGMCITAVILSSISLIYHLYLLVSVANYFSSLFG